MKTMENRLVDLSERLEMEMLERELCEEREEQAIEEREDLRRKLGELEGELALLQEEHARLEGDENELVGIGLLLHKTWQADTPIGRRKRCRTDWQGNATEDIYP